MGTDRLIYIRTDGNHNIASGHLVRCFSIALECQKLGMEVCFLVSDEESLGLLKGILDSHTKEYDYDSPKAQSSSDCSCSHESRKAFRIHCLKTASYDNLERELAEVTALLSSDVFDASALPSVSTSGASVTLSSSGASGTSSLPRKFDSENDTRVTSRKIIYLLDSYYVTEKYLLALKPLAKIVYLDDLQLFDYPVHLLINYDVIPDALTASYRAAYRNAEQLLLGAAYAPLRSQFQNRQITVRKQVKDVLITTGGSDPCHFCVQLIERIKKENLNFADSFCAGHITFHIVIGKLNTDRDILHHLAQTLPFLQLHENVGDMASLMERCDLAISAAGTTLYELCALGIPAVSFTLADNQLAAAQAFHEAGAIVCAGDMRREPESVLRTVIRFITENTYIRTEGAYIKTENCYARTENSSIKTENSYMEAESSYMRRKSAHEAMRRLVDGCGALRIAGVLEKL